MTRTRKKLKQAEKALAKALAENAEDAIINAKHAVYGHKNRIKRLENLLAELNKHHTNGTIPKIHFGGDTLWKRVCKGKAANREWRNARRNKLYARGDKTKGGNPNMKIKFLAGEFFMSVTLSHLSEQAGIDKLGRPLCPRHHG